MDEKVNDKTMTFSLNTENEEATIKNNLSSIYNSLAQKGYDPINQIAGYILSEDPTYITTHGGARILIQRIDRYKLLKSMICFYLSN